MVLILLSLLVYSFGLLTVWGFFSVFGGLLRDSRIDKMRLEHDQDIQFIKETHAEKLHEMERSMAARLEAEVSLSC